jgi:hypothetical protein
MNNNTKAKQKLLNGKDRSLLRQQSNGRSVANKHGKVAASGRHKKV